MNPGDIPAPAGSPAPAYSGRVRGPAGSPSPRVRTHKARSAAGLVVVALGLGLFLAAVLGAAVWAIALALHSASTA